VAVWMLPLGEAGEWQTHKARNPAKTTHAVSREMHPLAGRACFVTQVNEEHARSILETSRICSSYLTV
jgi:uncharacterized protein (DUF2336 family)